MSPVRAERGTHNHLSLHELNGALVSGLVCGSAAHSSWVFVSLWVSVSEWEPLHGWLMNDAVSISTAVPQSHHRDIHRLLAGVPKVCKGVLWAQIRRALWALLCNAQRHCVELSESPRASAQRFRLCVSCASRPLLADAFMFTELRRCSNVSLQHSCQFWK